MDRLKMTFCDPRALTFASWNPNRMDAINFQKLMNSIEELTFNSPVKVRELDDGTLEIIGGEHRTRAAIELGMSEVPVVNLGKISDKTAKQIMLADNERYGDNDSGLLSDLLNSDMGDINEILSILPFDEEQMEGYFSHDTGFEDVDFDALDDSKSDDIDLSSATQTKTHQFIRFKVPVLDAARISELVQRVQTEQGFEGDDELTNAGDALVHLLLSGGQDER